jgi:hypothetical protein
MLRIRNIGPIARKYPNIGPPRLLGRFQEVGFKPRFMEVKNETELIFAEDVSSTNAFILTTPICSEAECRKLTDQVKKVDSTLSKSMLTVTGFPLATLWFARVLLSSN